jgi:hypothetical protein
MTLGISLALANPITSPNYIRTWWQIMMLSLPWNGCGRVVASKSIKCSFGCSLIIGWILEPCFRERISFYQITHMWCVGHTLKPEIACSSNALLLPCAGNIYILLGLYSLGPPWIFNRRFWALRLSLPSLSSWKLSCWSHGQSGPPEMTLSSRLLLQVFIDVARNSKMTWSSLYIRKKEIL